MSAYEDKRLSYREVKAKCINAFFSNFFNRTLTNVGIPQEVLEKSSRDTDRSLHEDLNSLWMEKVKCAVVLKKNIFFELYFSDFTLLDLPMEELGKTSKYLYQYGKDYERFWFKEKNFEKFVETFEKGAEKEDLTVNIAGISHQFRMPTQFGIPIFLELELNESEVKKFKKKIKEEVKKGIQEILKKAIKEGLKYFIEDLKKIRGQLKNNLRGRFYWLKVSLKFATVYVLPWLVALVVIANFLKCNDSLGS